jgi:mono/diheme cytochrome c family protein
MSDLAASRTATHWLIVTLAAGALLIAVVAAVLVHMGSFDVAADKPHSQPVFWLMDTVRERSVAIRAAGITVPGDLTDAKRVASGAAQYDEMCSLCHLAPGMKRTEISRGLYPRAPELRRKSDLTPAEQFWVVKHGLKMTGMPAWGGSDHDDQDSWKLVHFIRHLPQLTSEEVEEMKKLNPKSPDELKEEQEEEEFLNGGNPHEHIQHHHP